MDKTAKAKDLLDNIVQRLEKIEKRQEDQIRKQSQTDEVLERLDTIHNRLERQNQKQNALDGKLSDVSYQLEQEKVVMRDQLQAAQNEILRRLTEIQEKGEEIIKIHGPSSQNSLDVKKNHGDTDEGVQQHSINTSLDPFDKEDQNPVHDLIRTEFEQLNKRLKDTLDENQQNVGKEISRSTEIASKQLNDFAEMTKNQLLAQTAGMDGKLDNITAANEEFGRQMLTCQETLTTIEQTNQKHVKDGVMFAVNELRNSIVTYLKSFFTKKTLVCLLLLFAVGLAVWYRSEGFTFMKSQAQHWMGNTKSQPDFVSKNDGNSIDDHQNGWNNEFMNNFKDFENRILSITKAGTQQILDKLRNTPGIENTKNQFVSITKAGTQEILDELRKTGDRLCKVKINKHDVEDIKAKFVSMIKKVKLEVVKNHSHFSSDIFGGTSDTTKLQQNSSQDTLNSSMEGVRSAEIMKVMLQSLDREAEHMMKLLNFMANSTLQQEVATCNERTNYESCYLYVTSAILEYGDLENMPYGTILLLYVAISFFWFTSFCKETKSEIIAATDKTKRDIMSFTEKENQLVRDRISGQLPSREMYIFDFYVENLRQLVNSNRVVTSFHWHINQFGTSVRGLVYFLYNGEMSVWLMHGRNPREVGLEPKLYGTLKFKATITDTSGGLPDLVVGEGTMRLDEKVRQSNKYWGNQVGENLPCYALIEEGYGEKEGYEFGALLIRYEITVL